MLTEVYKNKLKLYLSIYKFIYRFRVLFLILLAILIGTTGTLLSIKGMVIDKIKVSNVQYGQTLKYSSYGLFDNYIHYEFKRAGSEEWSLNEPKYVGNYEIRGVSKNIFGGYYYGKETEFTILPKSVDVTVSSLYSVYGNTPSLNLSLLDNDKLLDIYFNYDSFNENKAIVSFDPNSIVIINNEGEDVTYCYDFNFESSYEVSLKSRSVTFTSKDEFTYDGTSHNTDNLELTNGTLFEGDKVEIVNKQNFINGGSFANRPTLKFTDKANRDVTSFYDVDYTSDSRVTIKPREVTIKTNDFTKTYDRKVSSGEVSYKITEGSFINGDRIELEMPSYINVGTYDNKPTFKIYNKYGVIINDSYTVTFDCGKYKINPRRISVNISYDDKIYDGQIYNNIARLNVSGDLLNGDTINLYNNSGYDTLHAGTHKGELTVKIYDELGRTDYTKNYEINLTQGSFTVSKRTITICSQSVTLPYTGKEQSWPEYSWDGQLVEGDVISVVNSSVFKEIGEYDNNLTFSIKNNNFNTDVTNDYQINFIPGKVKIIKGSGQGGTGEGEGGTGIAPGGGDSSTLETVFEQFQDVDTKLLDNLIMRYTPTKSGSAFFRGQSIGVYDGKKWTKGTEYKSKYGIDVYEFIPNLLEGKMDTFAGKLEYTQINYREFDTYPYYTFFPNKQNTDLSVIVSDLKTKTINVEGFAFNYLDDHDLIDNAEFKDENVKNEEREYRKFVYENYLSLNSYQRNALNEIINNHHLKGSDLVSSCNNIINYFKNNGFFGKHTDLVDPNSSDILIDFLTKTKAGYCQFFAGGGALLLRAMGYPTRIARGVCINGGMVGKTYDVIALQRHAICEVYVDGKGWVNVEFTVAPLAEGEKVPVPDGAEEEGNALEDTTYDPENQTHDDPENPSEGEGGDTTIGGGELTDFSLHIYSGTQSFTYDGKEHGYGDYEIKGDLKEGHYIEVNGWSTITKVGQTTNDFSFVIKDEDGNVVNDEYLIEKSTGTISVTKRDLSIRTKSFNSSLINISSLKDEEIYEVDGLADGDKIVGSMILIKNASNPSTYQNVVIITKIVNEKGEDVTSCYNILYDYGTVVIG